MADKKPLVASAFRSNRACIGCVKARVCNRVGIGIAADIYKHEVGIIASPLQKCSIIDCCLRNRSHNHRSDTYNQFFHGMESCLNTPECSLF
jgi:hypothetical protein